jgi:transcriptional regulator of acetoin/glycerol metabolism
MVLPTSVNEKSVANSTVNGRLLDFNSTPIADLNTSWKRCQDRFMLDRQSKPRITSLTAPEIREQQEPFGAQLAMICNELEFVQSSLLENNFCVSFSDMAGIILYYQGDQNVGSQFDIERPGTIWAEGVAGTNGVGTCVIERQPVIVRGRDHYFSEFSALSCIAAPVLSADADMIGVLNVATANADVTSETMSLIAGLTMRTAERLSSQFFLNRYRKNTIMKIGNSGQTILLALDQDQRIIGANQGARMCYGWGDGEWRDRNLWSIFERSSNSIDELTSSESVHGLRRLDNHSVCDATLVHPTENLTKHKSKSRPVLDTRPTKPVAMALAEPDKLSIEDCLGPHPKMMAQAKLLRRVLGSSLPILLLGETGVGKDTLAGIVHETGERRKKPFVAFNCAAVPESLIDSELFGYGVGAFTGAKREGNLGRLQQAHGGTLFLDEIGDMPLSLQTRLLRVLESGEVSPLGSAKVEHVDVNIIAATNQNIRNAVNEGRFRRDLYYRLAGVEIELQPLRERSDLSAIANRLLKSNPALPPARLSDEALALMQSHSWPGNVRELKFVVQRAQQVCEDGIILSDDLFLHGDVSQSPVNAPEKTSEPGQALHDAERKVIIETLARFSSDVTKAAKALNMSRATLYRKIKLHKLGSQKVIN